MHSFFQPPRNLSARPALVDLASLGALIFAASLLGIATRPIGFFAIFWPANALLAGLMVRRPELSCLSGWVAATVGFLAADLLTGSTLPVTLWLTCSNLSGVAVAVVLMLRVDEATRQMQRQLSALYLLLTCCAAAAMSTLTGAGAGPVIFQTSLSAAFMLWFCTELMNYVLVLPVLLTMPVSLPQWRSFLDPSTRPWMRWGPLIAVVLSEVGAFFVGGPGAIAFVVPALLWCALTYNVFSVALLSMLVCFWKTLEMASDSLLFTPDHLPSVFSFRMGITLLSIGPLAAACASAARNEALRHLDRAVNTDVLTGAMARRAFLSDGERLLARLAHDRKGAAVLMIDLDHFKTINDSHGHAAGDTVLAGFAAVIAPLLRPGDLFGRLGGEEFAVMLPQLEPDDALVVAARLRDAVRAAAHNVPGGHPPLQVTASFGIVHATPVPTEATLDAMLQAADALLYQAKRQGRDCIVTGTFHLSPASPPHAREA